MIRSIRANDPFNRLVTTHPRSNARDEILDPTLLDFEMQQSGHGNPTEQHASAALEKVRSKPAGAISEKQPSADQGRISKKRLRRGAPESLLKNSNQAKGRPTVSHEKTGFRSSY